MSIQPIAPLTPLEPLKASSSPGLDKIANQTSGNGAQKAGADFSQFLNNALKQVNDLQAQGETASVALASGQVQDLSEVMVALEKANLSLSLTVATRDKVLDAYNQIMRMQI